jgi:hypothetical protein
MALTQDSEVNYKWISSIYALASVAAIALFAVETVGARPQTSFLANLNGVYIVFAPYVPCLVWTLSTQFWKKNATQKHETIAKKES